MLLLQPPESDKLTHFVKNDFMLKACLYLNACTCAVLRVTTVRPDDVFLHMILASQGRGDIAYKCDRGFLFGEAVSAYFHTVLSLAKLSFK